MSVLPSVQPFHAIAYPIDPMLALDIRYKFIFMALFVIYCGALEILINSSFLTLQP